MLVQPLPNIELNVLRSVICESLVTLHEQSETYCGHARILFQAAGTF
jgi:hypothetical protein